ncbi:unnamed protein product [Cyclocybe aegerita]|uniref:Uncharacterized protein n=1 Tax=Cyclocybe aegerita TaxID=1973307 RepID=A0A8S0XNS5_CYCAE|nr:unnamed protein product [Cyclocybe aegerita]
MTRYAMEEVQSRIVLHGSQETRTILDAPVTFGFTFQQGATQDKASRPVSITAAVGGQIVNVGFDRSCSLDIPNARGSCVEVAEDARLLAVGGNPQIPSFSTSFTTYTTTYSGALLPLATIDPESSSLALPSATSASATSTATPTSSTSGATSFVARSAFSILVVAIAGITAVCL